MSGIVGLVCKFRFSLSSLFSILCLLSIQKDQWWIIKIKEDPQARWSVVRRKAIRHYTSNHWQESEYVLSREANELQDMAHSFK